MSELKNGSIAYVCEFDLDTKEISVVLVVRSEDGKTMRMRYDDAKSIEYASAMVKDAELALTTLRDYGYEEGIQILGLAKDDEEPLTIEGLYE